jgi:predicted nucleic acid-binding protein
MPMRTKDTALLQLYDVFFSAQELRLIEIDRRVIDEATGIRAITGLKSPDALHLAAALVTGASVFLTGDTQLARFNRLSVELI